MSVRKKGRRKITYENKKYVWYVGLDYDSPYYILNIISEDKQLIIACPLNRNTPYAISKGTLFQNCKSDGHWNRYRLPFDVPEIITPGFVSELISWATKGSDAVRIEWDGKDIFV